MARLILALVLLALLLDVGISDGTFSGGGSGSISRWGRGMEVVQASEILAKIERGESVEYNFVTVEGDLDLELGTKTGYFATFRRAGGEIIVTSPISITNSEIRGDVILTKVRGTAIFRESIDFRGTNFSDDAYFSEARFDNDANFSMARFCGKADFSGAQFSGEADFSRAQFDGNADFEDAVFQNNLVFNNVEFTQLTTNGAIINHLVSNKKSTYFTFIENFKNNSQYDAADNLYYQYRSWLMLNTPLSCQKIIDLMALCSCGFGVRPSYTLLLSLAIIFFFGLMFSKRGALEATSSNQLITWFPEKREISISPIEAIYFSSLVFIHTWPHPKLRPSGRWKYWVLLEDVLGWLLLALFLVTLGNVMIR